MYYVYVVRQAKTNYIKIGVSDDPEERIRYLQTSSPSLLSIHYVIDCQSSGDALKVERLLHERYKSKRLEGEWFDIPYFKVIEDLDWVIEMSKAMLGTHHYRQEIVKQVVRDGNRPVEVRRDARTVVRRYLDTYPEAINMSVRELAKAAGVSKTIAHEELSAYIDGKVE